MKTRFSRLLAAPAVALALAGGAVAVAPAASASVDCVWQPLGLFNGWQSAQSNWNTGDPSYCVANGIVYLSGSLKNPTSNSSEFAQLPSYLAPTSTVYLQVYTYNGSAGELVIGSDGAMYADGNNSSQYTSLAGISFPAAGSGLTPITLSPGWQSAQSLYGTGDPSYVITNGIVYWTGSVTSSSTQLATPALVPEGLTPDHCTQSIIDTFGGTVGVWYLSQATYMQVGDTTIGATYYDQFSSLAGLSYPALGHASWLQIGLQNGWTQDNGTCNSAAPGAPTDGAPSYYVQDNVVYLSGGLVQPHPGSGFFGNLPAQARPAHDLYLLVVAGSDQVAYLHISPTGNMYLFGASQPTHILLSGLSFQAGS